MVELYPQFFLELITTQLRFYMVSPQLSLLITHGVTANRDDTDFHHAKPQILNLYLIMLVMILTALYISDIEIPV